MFKKSSFLLVLLVLCQLSMTALAMPLGDFNLTYRTNSKCEAPPPDSFRVETLGGGFVVLAWEPNASNALHTITVSEVDNNGNPLLIQTFEHIADPTLLVNDIEPGVLYEFSIATECEDGGHGPKDIISQVGLIIELTLGGDPPLNPEIVECDKILYKQANWIGFAVESTDKNGNTISNTFQIVLSYISEGVSNRLRKISIKRTVYDNNIVATNEEDVWPTIFNPILFVGSLFKMRYIEDVDLSNIGNPIGRVQLSIDDEHLTICPAPFDVGLSWDPSFTLIPLVKMPGMIEESSDRNKQEDHILSDGFSYNSIVSENLVLNFNDELIQSKIIDVSIFALNGKILVEEIQLINRAAAVIPLTKIPSGFYILTVKSDMQVITNKIFKI